MDLSKRLILLRHIDTFIREQYGLGTPTRDVLGMLSYKSTHYQKKLDTEVISGARKDYVQNYSLFLRKRVIDFQYFRNKSEFEHLNDLKVFNLLSVRDRMIFNKIYNKTN